MNNSKLNIKNINKIQNSNFTYNKLYYILDELKEIINNKKIFLVLCDMGYPPFGGGENWLIDVMNIAKLHNMNPVMICFKDDKNNYFSKFNIIKNNNCTYIQFIRDYCDYIKLIKFLNPMCIFHQGTNRIHYMKIANILNIPFITGFCFWQDIIEFDKNYSNINILSNDNITKSSNLIKCYKYCDYIYLASKFVFDVVKKLHNIELPIIETISCNDHFKILNNNKETSLTFINIHYHKNGWLVPFILENIEIDIPIILIDTEKNNKEFNDELSNLIEIRNNKYKNKVILYNKLNNISEIYEKTKLLIIGSLVDETFCKVAYEGMQNKIPILSTKHGNLINLLDGYADFLDDNPILWINRINKIVNDEKYIDSMKNRIPKNNLNYNMIETKLINVIKNIKLKNNFQLENNNIGIFVPWCDQGLGIQAREYYIELEKNNYNVHIFSFRSYNSTKENPLFQTNKKEWDYKNIHYCNNNREKINFSNVVDFIHKTKISKMIFIELCYENIYDIAIYFKLFNVKCIGIPNLEIIKYNEFDKYNIFDVILCNNKFTLKTLQLINIKYNLKLNIDFIGFHINHPFINYKNINCLDNLNNKKIEFFCVGGLNSIIRKHIDKICDIFETFKENSNIKLYIYIQGNEIPNILEKYNKNIIVKVKNRSYLEIINIYKTHDIFIHFGSHEGLGLGFYESISCGTPVLTIDTSPNNEIIINNITGWTIKSNKYTLKDNAESIIYGDIFDEIDFKKTINNIIKNYNRIEMFNNIVKHNINNNYIQNMIKHF